MYVGNNIILIPSEFSVMPWQRLQITKKIIWLCDKSSYLCAFNRTFKDDSVCSRDNWIIKQLNSSIIDIAPYNDVILISHRDGSIRQWMIKSRNGEKYFDEKVLEDSSRKVEIVLDVTSQHFQLQIRVNLRTGKVIHIYGSYNTSYVLTCMASDYQYALMVGTTE